MNLTLKRNGGFPSLLSDFLAPRSLMERSLLDMDSELVPARLGINLPTANVTETPKEYKIELAAPGLDRKDFHIEIENSTMIIKAEKEEKKEEVEGEYSRKEYSFNSFSRAFSLPENIKEDKIDAKYENGILKVTMPKQKETGNKPVHKISVT